MQLSYGRHPENDTNIQISSNQTIESVMVVLDNQAYFGHKIKERT